MAGLNEAPTESAEQQWLFQWARMSAGRYPELGLMYHVPNEGKRSRATGGRLLAEGYRVEVCRGFDEASDVIMAYLGGG